MGINSSSLLFKKVFAGKASSDNSFEFFSEGAQSNARLSVFSGDIWSEAHLIPNSGIGSATGSVNPGGVTSSGVVAYYSASGFGYIEGTSAGYSSSVKDWIPFNFGDGTYNYIVTKNDGSRIFPGEVGNNWTFDTEAGVLIFHDGNPSNVSPSLPPSMSAYAYIGKKLSGELGLTNNTLTNDITASGNISASGTIIGSSISSSGTITANSFEGDGSNLTGISFNSISGVAAEGNYAVTDGTASFTNITASGDISASGTISTSKLHINTTGENATGANAALFLESNNGDTSIRIGHNATITGFEIKYKGTDSGNNNDLEFLSDNIGFAGQTKWMNVKQNGQVALGSGSVDDGAGIIFLPGSGSSYAGNIGIGTASPGEKLQVAGNISSSGNIITDGKVLIGTSTSLHESADLQIQGKSGNYARIMLKDQDTTNAHAFIDKGGETLRITSQNHTSHGNISLSTFNGTDTTTRMYISGSGNVGIGTDSPNEKLEVTGNISASGNIIANSITSSNLQVSGNLDADGSVTIDGALSFNGLNFAQTSTTETIVSVLNASGSVNFGSSSLPSEIKHRFTGSVSITGSKLELGDNNKLLLGDASDLQIYHDGSNSYINQTGTGKLIAQSSNGNGINVQSATGETRFTISGTDSDIKVDDSSQVNKVVLKSNGNSYLNGGNVGIGTSTPSEKLELSSGAKIKLNPGATTNTTGSILFTAHDHDTIFSTFNDSTTGDLQQFVLMHNDADTELINRRGDLILSASTNRVGIGTNDPKEALEVVGNISASGAITASAFVGDGSGLTNLSVNFDNLLGVAAEGNYVVTGGTASLTHITASGNITASGIIFANELEVQSKNAHTDFDRLANFHDRFFINKKSNTVFLQVAQGGNEFEITDAKDGNSTKGQALLRVRGTDDHDGKLLLVPDSTSHLVGIGNELPTEKLTVEGNISASGNLIINAITSSGDILFSGENEVVSIRNTGASDDIRIIPNANLELGTSATDQIYIGRTDSWPGKIRLQAGSGVTMLVTGSKVGIGTIAPKEALEVVGNISASGTMLMADATMSLLPTVGSTPFLLGVSSSGEVIKINSDDVNVGSGTGTGNIDGVLDGENIIVTSNITTTDDVLTPITSKFIINFETNQILSKTDSSAFSELEVNDQVQIQAFNPVNGVFYTQNFTITEKADAGVAQSDSPFNSFVYNNEQSMSFSENFSPDPAFSINNGGQLFKVTPGASTGVVTISTSNNISLTNITASEGIITPNLTSSTITTNDLLLDNFSDAKIVFIDANGGTGANTFKYNEWKASATNGISINNTNGIIGFDSKGNSNTLVVSRSNVGIGTTTPQTLLHIQGSSLSNFDQDDFTDFIIEAVDARQQIVSNDGGNNGSALILTNVDTSDGTHRNWAIGTATSAQNNIFHIGYNESTSDISTYTAADLVIDKNGNVGIGTSSPTYKLDVETADDIVASFVSTDNKAAIQISDDDTTGYVSAENDKLSLGANAGVNANHLNIDVTTNNVGIGTSSPLSKLEVVGNISASGTITANSFVGDGSSLTNLNLSGVAAEGNYVVTGGTASLTHITASGNITASGGVIAGVVAVGGPIGSYPLSVIKNGSTLGENIAQFKHSDDASHNPFITISSTTTGVKMHSAFSTGIDGSYEIQANGGNSYIAFNTNGNNERVRINSSGEVGIGTTTPTATLDVNGDINTNSHITASGNISASGHITASNIFVEGNLETTTLAIDGISFESAESTTTTITSTTNTLSGSVIIGSGSSFDSPLPINNFHQITGSVEITGSGIFPSSNDGVNLGDRNRKFNNLFALNTFFGGIHEINLETKGLDKMQEGTILSLKNSILHPCENEADPLVMGVVSEKSNYPIILGAEPVLVTGKVEEGDYIITSNIKGHGIGINPKYIYDKQLFGKIIAQAIENGDGKSYTIKAMIRKM